ncbi:hypothetical protein [Candidatus Burkholderia verschuerenii]|nr:hypothetical protein [Candidatus Burkholderia verschuerenii]
MFMLLRAPDDSMAWDTAWTDRIVLQRARKRLRKQIALSDSAY